jgi:hypothetical protein
MTIIPIERRTEFELLINTLKFMDKTMDSAAAIIKNNIKQMYPSYSSVSTFCDHYKKSYRHKVDLQLRLQMNDESNVINDLFRVCREVDEYDANYNSTRRVKVCDAYQPWLTELKEKGIIITDEDILTMKNTIMTLGLRTLQVIDSVCNSQNEKEMMDNYAAAITTIYDMYTRAKNAFYLFAATSYQKFAIKYK